MFGLPETYISFLYFKEERIWPSGIIILTIITVLFGVGSQPVPLFVH